MQRRPIGRAYVVDLKFFYRQWLIILIAIGNERGIFPKRSSLAGAAMDPPGVLSEFSVRLVLFGSLRSIIIVFVVCRYRASQLVEWKGV